MKNGESQVLDLQLNLRLCENSETCQRESQMNWWLFNFLLGTTSVQQWSVHMHLPWLTQKRDEQVLWWTWYIIKAISKSDKLLLLGNFNVRVGSDHHPWNGVIGSQGIGKCNSHGLLLLQLCSTYNLVITNTLFHLPTHNKTSWMHPRSKHWHLIDYVITGKKDGHLWSRLLADHGLILSKVNLKIAPKRCPQGKKVFRKLDMPRLKHKPTAEALHSDLDKKLENLTLGDAFVEDNWTAFKDIVYSTAFEHLGPSKWHYQD